MVDKKAQKLKKAEAELMAEFERWEHLKVNGGSDPFWSDGVNMNLVRNHIIYHKRAIEELEPETYPAVYAKETPQEVRPNYMARWNEIRNAVVTNLKVLENDKDLLFLRGKANSLSKAEREQASIGAVLQYEERLRQVIRNGDLVAMRRYENLEGYLEDIRKCRERVEGILQTRDDKGLTEEKSGQICFAFAT